MVWVNQSLQFFFHRQCVSPYVTENVSARCGSSQDPRQSRELQGLGQRLGSCNVLSWTKFWTSRSRLGLGDMGLGSRLKKPRAHPWLVVLHFTQDTLTYSPFCTTFSWLLFPSNILPWNYNSKTNSFSALASRVIFSTKTKTYSGNHKQTYKHSSTTDTTSHNERPSIQHVQQQSSHRKQTCKQTAVLSIPITKAAPRNKLNNRKVSCQRWANESMKTKIRRCHLHCSTI